MVSVNQEARGRWPECHLECSDGCPGVRDRPWKGAGSWLREEGSAGVGIPPPSEHASLGDQWDVGMREAGWD